MTEAGQHSLADVSVEQWTLRPSPRKAVVERAERSIQSDTENASSSGSSSSSDRLTGTSMAILTPNRLVGGILRMPDTPGTGRSVRFGKRLYDDGDESRMSDSFSSIKLASASRRDENSDTVKIHDESIDEIEKSLQSMSTNQVDVGGRSVEDTMAQLPSVYGYSNLLEDEVSLDESILRSEMDKLKNSMRRDDAIGESSTPQSATTDTSHYQSAKSGGSVPGSPLSDGLEWNTPLSASRNVKFLHVQGHDGADVSGISTPWATSLPSESPSAERAERADISLLNQSRAILLPGAFRSEHSGHPIASNQCSPSLIRANGLLDLSCSTSDSSLEELLRATQELDYVHFEHSEALRKRLEQVEEELARLRGLDHRKQQALRMAKTELRNSQTIIRQQREEAQRRERLHDERMQEIDGLVCTLTNDYDKARQERLQVLSESFEGDKFEAVKRQLQEELKYDYEMDKYTLQRKHEEEIERLNAQLSEQQAKVDGRKEGDAESACDPSLQSAELQHRNLELEEEMRSYRERLNGLEELQQQSDELRQELQSQWRHSEEAREREVELHSRVHDLEEDVKGKEYLCESLQNELSMYRDDLRKSEDLRARLEEDKEAISEQHHSQEAKAEALYEDLRETKSLLDAAQRKHQDAMTVWQSRQTEWEQEKEKMLHKYNSDLADVASSHKAHLEKLEVEKEAVESALAAANVRIEEGQEQLDTMRQHNVSMQTRMSSLEECLLEAQARITDLQLEGSTTSKGIESVKRDLSDAQSANSNLKSVVSRLESHVDVVTEQKDRAISRKADLEERCVALQEEVLSLTEKVQEATQRKSISHVDEKAQKRIREVEKESSDRGMLIAKLQKAKQRLEEDNFNFSIALAAKQQELGMVKRKYNIKAPRSSQTIDATQNTIHGEKKALLNISNVHHDTVRDDNDDTLPALQKGPAHLKATRRKTIDGKAVELSEGTAKDSTGETHTSTVSKVMPPPMLTSRTSYQTSSRHASSFNHLGSRRSSGTSNRTSLASSITATHGPMELSELFPVQGDPISQRSLISSYREGGRLPSSKARLRESRAIVPA